MWAVCESARNVAVTGASPYGVTNNLNFGNPYIPENYYVFSECVRGLGDACRFLGLPVTGGNVSFYNESPEGPVFPTPTIGMVGYIDNVEKALHSAPKEIGTKLALIGKFRPTLGGSEYLSVFHKMIQGSIPEIHLDEEKKLMDWILQSNQEGILESAKDLSLGGLAIALIKIAFQANQGIRIKQLPKIERLDQMLFGETSCSIIIGYKESNTSKMKNSLNEIGLDFFELGETTESSNLEILEPSIQIDLKQSEIEWMNGLVNVFN
jgi:phosphoribosylformylglycinamidine synthase